MDDENRAARQAKCEQAMAEVSDMYPAFWRRMYSNLLKEGFGHAEAMDILKTYILSMGTSGGQK